MAGSGATAVASLSAGCAPAAIILSPGTGWGLVYGPQGRIFFIAGGHRPVGQASCPCPVAGELSLSLLDGLFMDWQVTLESQITFILADLCSCSQGKGFSEPNILNAHLQFGSPCGALKTCFDEKRLRL
jgi:hypothetical protein